MQGPDLNRILKAVLSRLNVEEASRYSAHILRLGASTELLNLGTTLAVIMKTAGWNSDAFRAYFQFRLDGESDMKAVLLQIHNRTHAEPEDEQPAEIPRSDFEHPVVIDAGDSPSSSAASSARRYERACAGGAHFPGYVLIACLKNLPIRGTP